VRTEELANKVAGTCQDGIVGVSDALVTRLENRIAERDGVRVPAQKDRTALAVQAMVNAECAQRIPERGGMAHELTEQPHVIEAPELSRH